MRIRSIAAAACILPTLLSGPIAAAQSSSAAPAAQQAPPGTTAPVVPTQADQLLKQMSAYIGSAWEFTFHADITFDHVLTSGQKLEYAAAEDVALQRPDGLYVEGSGDLGDRQFNGTTYFTFGDAYTGRSIVAAVSSTKWWPSPPSL